MIMITYRLHLVEIGRRLYAKEMIAGSEGNISLKLNDHRILTTPTGLCKGLLRPDDLVEVDANGLLLKTEKGRPSSELPMHLAIYRARPDVKAVVHAHPIVATGFALAGIPLVKNFLPEIILTFGEIPLTRYGTPSTCELSEEVARLIKNHDGLLLANHGAVTVGKDLDEAYFRMDVLEHYAKTVLVARQLGTPQELSTTNMAKLRALTQQSVAELTKMLDCKIKNTDGC